MKELPLPEKPVERDLFIVVLSFGKHTVVLSFGKHTPTTSIHIWHVVSQTIYIRSDSQFFSLLSHVKFKIKTTTTESYFLPVIMMCVCPKSCLTLLTPWTVARQAPLSMGFSRQEYWSGLPHPPPGDLPNPGIEPCLFCLLHWQVGSLPLAPPGKPVIMMGKVKIE